MLVQAVNCLYMFLQNVLKSIRFVAQITFMWFDFIMDNFGEQFHIIDEIQMNIHFIQMNETLLRIKLTAKKSYK